VKAGVTLPRMVVTLDVDGARPSDLVAGASPLAELMACLHVLAEPEHHPESRGWVTRAREGLPEGLAHRLTHHAPLWARYRCRLLYPLGPPLDRDLSAELDALLRLDQRVFVGLAGNALRGTAAAGEFDLADEAAQRAFVKACERRSFSRGELARALIDDPEEFRAELVETLGRCEEAFFAAEWRRVGPRLRDTAARVRQQVRRAPASAVLTAVSPTATAKERPARVHFDKLQSATGTLREHGCLLIPTLHGWPHLIVKLDPGHPLVVHFIAGDWEQRPGVPQSLIRDRLAALAEPTRFELCRHLIGEPITTSELAERMGLTAPKVSRHLGLLREVGLITSRREGRLVYHRLHARLLMDLGPDVLTTMMR
jgi:DNA-binding transcriptional ArsR family regulator